MKNLERIYAELRKEYTLAVLADAYNLPEDTPGVELMIGYAIGLLVQIIRARIPRRETIQEYARRKWGQS
jgi:hypothetical protein